MNLFRVCSWLVFFVLPTDRLVEIAHQRIAAAVLVGVVVDVVRRVSFHLLFVVVKAVAFGVVLDRDLIPAIPLADLDLVIIGPCVAFAEIIERCSYGVNLYAGDVIGSGTVGTGCFLELNGTGKLNDPNYTEQWLQENDTVEMEIDGLGKLSNTIVKEESDLSLLALKKI